MSKPRYIDAAFRSSKENEVYLFMKDEYILVNYAPGSKNDKIVNGPLRIRDGFPSLANTQFATNGIDCAFDSEPSDEIIKEIDKDIRRKYYRHGITFANICMPFESEERSDAYEIANSEAYIFSGNHCAFINYAPHTKDDEILAGPFKISYIFPFFRGTIFEHGIDAAFRSSKKTKEAYLFKGGFYARINYESECLVQNIQCISKGFPSLVGTIFESGVDAAFASHKKDEAYLFKGEYYVLINFAPGTTNDYIIGGGVKRILDHWPSLRGIIPRYN